MNLKFTFIVLLLWNSMLLICQDNSALRTIKAGSEKVDIRVGSDFFSKGGWHLDPSQNPDIFRIGSKWNYDKLSVSFITDLDSLTFDVRPNSSFDFIIVLDEDKECHIRVMTAPHPVLLNWNVVFFIFLSLGFSCMVLLRSNSIKSTNRMLIFGIVTPILFWLLTFIAGSFQKDYKHTKNVISELGSLGTSAEVLTGISFIFIALCSFIFSMGFIKASRRFQISVIPSYSTFVMPMSFAWAAIFPLGNEFHSVLGMAPILLILGALLSLVLWKKVDKSKLQLYTLISSIFMMLILLRFVSSLGVIYEGLIQRFFYLGWTIWFFSISLIFRHKIKEVEVELLHLKLPATSTFK